MTCFQLCNLFGQSWASGRSLLGSRHYIASTSEMILLKEPVAEGQPVAPAHGRRQPGKGCMVGQQAPAPPTGDEL